jgi:hypothetical protein
MYPFLYPFVQKACFHHLVTLMDPAAETCGCVKMWHAVLSEPRHQAAWPILQVSKDDPVVVRLITCSTAKFSPFKANNT